MSEDGNSINNGAEEELRTIPGQHSHNQKGGKNERLAYNKYPAIVKEIDPETVVNHMKVISVKNDHTNVFEVPKNFKKSTYKVASQKSKKHNS